MFHGIEVRDAEGDAILGSLGGSKLQNRINWYHQSLPPLLNIPQKRFFARK